jgi:hypothetical protein
VFQQQADAVRRNVAVYAEPSAKQHSRMPVEDPKALAQTYLAKHNVEKIFEVR